MPSLRFQLLTGATLLAIAFAGAPARAEHPLLRQGIAEYNAGDYSSAIGHLGQVLTAEFNNAILHYYMANAFLHLKQKDDAIREFRIAHALAPDKEVGRLCHQALTYLDAVGPQGSQGMTDAPASRKEGLDPQVEAALASLERQTEEAKQYYKSLADARARETDKAGQEAWERTRREIISSLTGGRRAGRIELPPDAMQQLDQLREIFQRRRKTEIQTWQSHEEQLQSSAENLRLLLNDKKKSKTKLMPRGTNLYIRNYQHD